MTDRIFYSWQSDCPGSTNRNFISTALEKAIEEVRNDDSISVEPVIDRDTLGIAGSPDITESIFSKIENSSVFVCDVSIIEQEAKKRTPNPNVLIELGYAIKVLGWNRIIMIMNTEFGDPTVLPFDLRAKRILTYSVAANTEEKAPDRNALKKTLIAALKLIFEKEGTREITTREALVTSDTKKIDLSLFEKFKEVLPSKGSIHFIAQQNMAGFSFPRKELDDLDKFYYEWNDAEHEFLDNELEQLRLKLHDLIGDYLGQIATNTFPTNNPGWQTVPPEWEDKNSKHFLEVVGKLHDTAGKIIIVHQDLVRKARVKLGT
ncbi:nucleotide-binding protein [Nitrosomonas oligotropha]|uniref:nucleotide-binding protein n=1 Tax=Nitrosomonas oligotropha TaxID=42354 RepID=UPI00136CAE26|nr:nucleotide-binding protein [Nitrosomonas oligotropha]MXS82403.1 hypothetical protein [Nitrosomonas oligotropha]